MFNPRVPLYHPNSPKQSSGPASIQPDEIASTSRAGTAQAASTTNPFVPAEDIFQPSHSRHVQGPSGSGPDEQEPGLFQQAFFIPETGQPAQIPMLEDDEFLRILLQEPTLPEPIFPEPIFSESTFPGPIFPEPIFSESTFPGPIFPDPTLPEPTFPALTFSEPALPESALPEPPPPPNVSQDSSRPDKGKQPMTMQPLPEQSGFSSHEPSGSSSSHQPFNPLHEDFLPESFSSYQANLEDAAVIEQLIAMGGLKPPSPVAASHHQLDSDTMPDAPWHEDELGKAELETEPTSSAVKNKPGKKRKRPPAAPKDPRRLGLSMAEQKKQFLDFYHAHQDKLKHHDIIQKFRKDTFYIPDATSKKWLKEDGIKKTGEKELEFYDAFGKFLKSNAELISKPYQFILNNFLCKDETKSFSSFSISTLSNFVTRFFKENLELHQRNQNPQRKEQFLAYCNAPENKNKTPKQRREDFSRAFFSVPERTAWQWLKEGLLERDLEFQEAFLPFYRKNPELADQTKLVQAEKFLQSDESGDFSKLKKDSVHTRIINIFKYNPKLRDPHYREEPQPEQLEAPQPEASKTKKHSKTETKPLTKKDLEFQAAFGVFYKKNPDLARTSNNRLGEGFTKQEEGKAFSNLSLKSITNHISKFFKHNPELRTPQQLKVQAGPSASPSASPEDSDHMIERSMDEQ